MFDAISGRTAAAAHGRASVRQRDHSTATPVHLASQPAVRQPSKRSSETALSARNCAGPTELRRINRGSAAQDSLAQRFLRTHAKRRVRASIQGAVPGYEITQQAESGLGAFFRMKLGRKDEIGRHS